MAAVDNHYEFLGLEPSASHAELEAAIEQVSEQAIALVYSSPQRSADLWERIRHMRRDLLATSEGRQVYDEALRRSEHLAGGEGEPLTEFSPAFHQSEAPAPPTTESPRLLLVPPVAVEEEHRAIAWPYALIAAAAVFVAVAGALVAREPGVTPARRPVAMTLSQLGSSHGSKFVSGGSVTLVWTRVSHASMYHLQIATAPGDPTDAAVFAHGSRTISVTISSYRLRVIGSQVYYWRVQARIGKSWQRYTASQHFAVAKPSVTKPVALAPISGIAQGGKHARLCWSAVPHAFGYQLRVEGQATRTVSGTCITLSMRPRNYRWSVAALVRGVTVYTGAYSVAAVVRVQPARPATRKSHTLRHTLHHVTKRHIGTNRSATTSRHPSRSAPSPVEVAAAMGTSRSVAWSRRRTLRSAIASVQWGRTTERRPRTTSVRTTRAVLPKRTSSAQPRYAATGASGSTGASGYVPRPPSTPARKRTPPASSTATASRLPAPPAPPVPPSVRIGSSPTAPALPPAHTQVVAVAKSPTPSTGIVVRPIVAAQIPTTSSGSPTSSSTSPATATYPSLQATPTTSAPAAKTTGSAITTDPKHPEHPQHPVHPTHSDHPAHP